ALSTIPLSTAKAMGMTIYNADVTVGTSGSGNVQTSLAVADSLWFGDVLVKNLLFLLVPDETMSFPQINYTISGIIGFPVMLAVEEIHLQKEGPLFIPLEPAPRYFSNLCMEGLSPYVQLFSGSDALVFKLDTGARVSELSKRYYDNHREAVDIAGRDTVTMRGSAAGIQESREKILTGFPFRIGSAEGVLADMRVTLEDYRFTKSADGNLGQDVLTQFDTMILNFQDMFIDFE
ncbi:MAG: retropepsin-like domain-containing protein, partial [Alistipes sp.]|nr:retropepsin-like domain-containing protein [Alistipes sp.]